VERCDVSCHTTGDQDNSPPSSGGIPGYSDSSHRYDHPSTPDWVMDEAKCRLGAVYNRSVARALNRFHLLISDDIEGVLSLTGIPSRKSRFRCRTA
jgi:hypothetical protein